MLNIEQLRELIIDQLENITDYDLLDLVYKLLLAEG
jgi:hypothetical protein